jgi:hypothetical protein
MAVCEIENSSGSVLLESFNASYASSQYAPGDYKPSYFWPENAELPIYFDSKEDFSQLTLVCYFKNAKLSDIEDLKKALKKCVITINNHLLDGRQFDCMLIGTQISAISTFHYSVIFTFDCLMLSSV